MAPAQMGKKEALKRFATNLTERAKKGQLDPVSGRDEEIRQIVDILMRRRQNNPILTGEAGVGKTAVVEGFAARIAAGDVPPPLKNVQVYTLDIGLLQAGASMKGEFENRLRQVIDEVQASPKPIILFVDEAHTLIGAGGAAGTGDAANLLKPALARGTLRTIAATTWAEYKKYIEKDPALTRRFQVVQIGEPSEEKATLMLRGVASTLEKHHRVQLLDEALEAAVRLSHRYIPARQLPDKAVSLLDTVCARVAISQHAVPPQLEDCRRTIEALEIELGIIGREEAVGVNTAERRRACEEKLAAAETRRADLEARWDGGAQARRSHPGDPRHPAAGCGPRRVARRPGTERLEGRTLAATAKTAAEAAAGRDRRRAPLRRSTPEQRAQLLAELRRAPVAADDAAGRVAADPAERRRAGRRRGRRGLDRRARRPDGEERGRDAAEPGRYAQPARDRPAPRARDDRPPHPHVARASSTTRTSRSACSCCAARRASARPRPRSTLAEALYGGEQNVITINMSEFQEKHTVSTLKGSPPGYVGYGEGGILTEAVRRRPYSVVLLDEVEKAHSDVHELFFQVFDKGWMEDARGPLHRFQEHGDPADVERRHRADHQHVQGSRAAAGAGGHCQGAARAAAQEVPRGAARTAGGDSLLSAERRHAREHRPAAARAHRAPGGGSPQDSLHLRRRGRQADRQPLHRGGKRRSHDRCDPDQHRAAGDQSASS